MQKHSFARSRVWAILLFNVTVGWSVMLPAATAAGTDADAKAADWIVLFNGRDLNGWIPKVAGTPVGENYRNTFSVADGVLRVGYENFSRFDDHFGHLFYQEPFSYYRLRVEYRFVGEQAPGGPGGWAQRNSGVMFHSQSPQSMLLNQPFPLSIEAQFLGGLSDDQPRPTANVCTPGTEIVYQGSIYPQHCLYSTSATLDGEQWVRFEMRVLGAAEITHFVNGEQVLTYTLPQFGGEGVASGFDPALKEDGVLLNGGYIALQSESHPVEFRRIELLNLEGCMDSSNPAYRAYFVKSAPARCR